MDKRSLICLAEFRRAAIVSLWRGLLCMALLPTGGVGAAWASTDADVVQEDVIDPESVAHPDAEKVRVLPPTVADVVIGIFSRVQTRIQLVKAEIDVDVVNVGVCMVGIAPKTCAQVTLSDPTLDCSGSVIGPWCVTIDMDREAAKDSILAILSGSLVLDSAEDIWLVRSKRHVTVPDPGSEAATLSTAGGGGASAQGTASEATSAQADESRGSLAWWIGLSIVAVVVAAGVVIRRRETV